MRHLPFAVIIKSVVSEYEVSQPVPGGQRGRHHDFRLLVAAQKCHAPTSVGCIVLQDGGRPQARTTALERTRTSRHTHARTDGRRRARGLRDASGYEMCRLHAVGVVCVYCAGRCWDTAPGVVFKCFIKGDVVLMNYWLLF